MTDSNGQDDHTQPVSPVGLSCWPRLLSARLLARYLAVGEQTIYNRQAEIPGIVRLGRSVRWDRLIIDQWVAQGEPGADLFG